MSEFHVEDHSKMRILIIWGGQTFWVARFLYHSIFFVYPSFSSFVVLKVVACVFFKSDFFAHRCFLSHPQKKSISFSVCIITSLFGSRGKMLCSNMSWTWDVKRGKWGEKLTDEGRREEGESCFQERTPLFVLIYSRSAPPGFPWDLVANEVKRQALIYRHRYTLSHTQWHVTWQSQENIIFHPKCNHP